MHGWVDRQVDYNQPKDNSLLAACLFSLFFLVFARGCLLNLLYCSAQPSPALLCPVDAWFFVDVAWIETEQERNSKSSMDQSLV